MKRLKTVATFAFLGGMLTLATGCPPGGYEIGAAVGLGVLLSTQRPVYYGPPPILVPAPYPIIRPMGGGMGGGAPPGFQGQPNGAPPGFQGSGGDMRILMNDKEVTHDQVTALANSNYGFDQAVTDKIIAALAAAHDGDNLTAANGLGITKAMADEMKSGTLSDSSADQIASAVGTSKESMRKYVHDINDATKAQNIPAALFDVSNCDDHCG